MGLTQTEVDYLAQLEKRFVNDIPMFARLPMI
jgi:hypothetical protein